MCAAIGIVAVSCVKPATDLETSFLFDDDVICMAPVGWKQPPSTHLGYEGYCGQTSIANMLLYEGREVLPSKVAKTCKDKTPGTRPDTMLRCINRQSDAKWSLCDERCLGIDADDYRDVRRLRRDLARLLRTLIDLRGPVVAFTHETTLTYHWQVVTASTEEAVSTMENSRSVVSYRDSTPWEEFEDKWKRGDGLVGSYLFLVRDEKPAAWTGNEDACDFATNRRYTDAVSELLK